MATIFPTGAKRSLPPSLGDRNGSYWKTYNHSLSQICVYLCLHFLNYFKTINFEVTSPAFHTVEITWIHSREIVGYETRSSINCSFFLIFENRFLSTYTSESQYSAYHPLFHNFKMSNSFEMILL